MLIRGWMKVVNSPDKAVKFETGYEKLGDAIVEQALRDYYYTLRRLKKNPHDYKEKRQLHELLEFFNSSYCEILASFDVEPIMRKLERRV